MGLADINPIAQKKLKWIKCGGDSWCSFQRVNLDHPHFNGLSGVYIIWHGGSEPRTVYVGSGMVSERLEAHRSNLKILMHGGFGLFVTWAETDVQDREGIERFLGETLRPLVSDRFPRANPISVSLPW